MVVRVHAEPVAHVNRRLAAEYSHTAVALLVGVIPVLVISRQFEFQLTRLKLGFLQAENIGVFVLKDVGKAFAHTGAKAVDVPGQAFDHGVLLLV